MNSSDKPNIQIFSNSLEKEELEAVRRVFDSKWVGRGKECSSFETELAQFWSVPKVFLFNCCSSAIAIGLRALGLKAGDEVIIPSLNFVAIPNAVLELGAKPVFADVDPVYFHITPAEIERLKTPKTRAVFLLHYGGHAVDFDAVKAACGPSVRILEDSANAVSSSYKGTACGALGDIGVMSFDAMKMLVMGDGGAMIVKDKALWSKIESLRYLGFSETTTSGTDAMKKGAGRWWEFQVDQPSGRFISNDILAAIGRVQLKKLPGFIDRRRKVWALYQKLLKGLPGLTLPPEPRPDTQSSCYLYWLRLQKRDALAHHLKEKGIYTTFRYFPLHLVKSYGHKGSLKNSEAINETTLNLPIHQNLTDAEVTYIADSIREFFKA